VLVALPPLGFEPVVARPGGETSSDGLIQYLRIAARGDRRDPMDLRWARRRLRAAVRDVGPALLHIVGDPWTPTSLAGAAAGRDLKVPYVLVATSSVGGPTGLTARWQADRVRADASALAGTVHSALDHLLAGARDHRPAAVLPLGGLHIPVVWEPRPDPSRIVFGVVGRLVPERGLDLVLDALAACFGDWRLRIIGSGPEQENLEAQAQRLGLSSRVEWLGVVPRERLAEFWSGIDVLLAPSRSTPSWVEPTGRLVLEAMARGVAPVVSRCGALPDVVGEGGLIIDERDGDALMRAIASLIAEPSRCRVFGTAARQRVLERYSDGAVAERMARLWRRVLEPGAEEQ
jgi:glycosyltransferase involved in cell wall biosynthesis